MANQDQIDHKINAIIQQMIAVARLSAGEKMKKQDLLLDFKNSLNQEKQSCLDKIDELNTQEKNLQSESAVTELRSEIRPEWKPGLGAELSKGLGMDQSLAPRTENKLQQDFARHFSTHFDSRVHPNSAKILAFRPRK